MVARVHMFQKQISKEQKANMLKEQQRRNLTSGRTSEGESNNHEDMTSSLSFCRKQFSTMMNLFAPEIHAANMNHDE